MKNKKKICLGIIILLLLIIGSCLIITFMKGRNVKFANSNTIKQKENKFDNEVLEEIDTTEGADETLEEDITENEESNDDLVNEKTSYAVTKLSTLTTSNSSIKSPTAEQTVNQSQTAGGQTTSQIPSVVKPSTEVTGQVSVTFEEVKQEKTETAPKEEQQEQPKQEQPKQEIPKQEQQQPEASRQEQQQQDTKDEELYVRNDAMIAQIMQVIENNASENMLTYGYEIVVDSSIKELTNQFTFTENRVKNFIVNKFGTIRIYAEDYYRNGQLIMTECYLI